MWEQCSSSIFFERVFPTKLTILSGFPDTWYYIKTITMLIFPCDFAGAFLHSFACCAHSILFNHYNSLMTRCELMTHMFQRRKLSDKEGIFVKAQCSLVKIGIEFHWPICRAYVLNLYSIFSSVSISRVGMERIISLFS